MVFPRKKKKYTEKDFINFIIIYDKLKEFDLVEHYVERILNINKMLKDDGEEKTLSDEKQERVLFEWESVKPQFNEEQQKEMEHIIWMAKSTGEPQKAVLGNTGLSFAVFPTGLIYKIEFAKQDKGVENG